MYITIPKSIWAKEIGLHWFKKFQIMYKNDICKRKKGEDKGKKRNNAISHYLSGNERDRIEKNTS